MKNKQLLKIMNNKIIKIFKKINRVQLFFYFILRTIKYYY